MCWYVVVYYNKETSGIREKTAGSKQKAAEKAEKFGKSIRKE